MTRAGRRRRCPRLASRTFVLAGVAAAACTHDSTAPRMPAALTLSQGGVLTGIVGAALATAPTIIVKDASGSDVGNVTIAVSVTAGGGSLTGAPTRTGNGPTSVGRWTLGAVAGVNMLTVSVAGLAPLVISATGVADAPSRLAVISGDLQSAPAGTPLAQRLVFAVTDRFGNTLPNVAVAFSVSQGGGFLIGNAGSVSDAIGTVTAPIWALGRLAAPQQLVATAGTNTAGLITVVANATVETEFRAEVRFFGPPVDPVIQQSFMRATQRVGGMLVGDVPDVGLASFDVATQCGVTGVAPMSEFVDDVVIYATVAPIDGPGRVLGSAGPCFVRSESQGRFTVVGVMRFDVADLKNLLNDGRLDDVILHEMLHVLGFGTLWQLKGLGLGAGTAASAFTGTQALQGCVAAGGFNTCATSVPVENTGGPGTADGHWRESVFRTELMTGFVSSVGVPNPLSLMTIGSLADLGYVVNLSVNDEFSLPSAIAGSLNTIRASQGAGSPEFTEELLQPRVEAGPGGRAVPLPPPR